MSSVHQKIIKHKIGLLNLAAELGNVSRACKVMGFPRDTFYRYQSAMEEGGSKRSSMTTVASQISRTASRKPRKRLSPIKARCVADAHPDANFN